jgi:ankyrin repeat protein
MQRAVADFGSGVNSGAQIGVNEGIVTNNFYGPQDLTTNSSVFSGFRVLNNRINGPGNGSDVRQSSLRTYPTEGECERLLHWLNAVFTDEEWENTLNSRTPKTCEWIFQRLCYQNWASSAISTNSMSILWVYGPPGSGKSVLSASIVEQLKNENPSRVAYFFCVSEDETKRQPFAIVRSWVAQMVRQTQEALELAREIYRGKEGRLATSYDIWQLFTKICRRISNCYFVVDGFDECAKSTSTFPSLSDVERFLRGLINISQETPCRILLVSRQDADVRNLCRRLEATCPNSVSEYPISVSDIQNDLILFSASIVEERLPKKSIDLKKEIATEASQRCQGMFLWIRLLGNGLNPAKNTKELRKMVNEMPTGIERTYERDLIRISNLNGERDRAIAILRWTLFALRPLTVRELTEALAVDVDDDCGTYPRDDLPDTWEEDEVNDQIRRLCGSLIELRRRDEQDLPQNQTIHFVHFSVREYLCRATAADSLSLGTICLSNSSRENDLLSRICLCYMSYDEIRQGRLPSEDAIQRKTDRYRFLKYAAESWYVHARNNVKWSEELLEMTNKFFEPPGSTWILWTRLIDLKQFFRGLFIDLTGVQLEDISPLFYACCLGLIHCVRRLSKQEVGSCSLHSSHVHVAAVNGHIEAVTFLIEEHGADVNMKDHEERTPLHLAVMNGHIEVVKFLVEHQAEVNVKKENAEIPLHLAAKNGHIEVVEFLIRHRADVDAKSKEGETPLHLTAENGHIEVVRSLIKHQAEVNIKDQQQWMPLHLAAQNGHVAVVEFLIQHQAEVNASNETGETPLHLAAMNGHIEVVKFLIEYQAEANVKTEKGDIPLHLAAESGDVEVVEFLIEHQAEVNASNENGETPLHLAAESGDFEVVEFLIEHQAEVNVGNENGETPLHLAALNGHTVVVGFLIKRQAEVNAKSQEEWTPLHAVAENGHIEVVRLLIEHQAEVNAKSHEEWTPLHIAAENGHMEVVRLLIEHQAEVNAKSQEWTPLHMAAKNGHIEVVRLLTKHQAEINAKSQEEWTPLHAATGNGHIEVVRLLIEH